MAKKLPVIRVFRNGKEYLRSRPETVRRTEPSITASVVFGTTSVLAANLKTTFKPLVPIDKGQDIFHRLLSSLIEWRQDIQHLGGIEQEDIPFFNGFRFLKKTSVASKLRFKPGISYQPAYIEVSLPAFAPQTDLVSPPGCAEITFQWMAVSCDPRTGHVLSCNRLSTIYARNMQVVPADNFQLPITDDSPCLSLIALALNYDNIQAGILARPGSRAWLPAGIVGSCYRGGQ